jgi:hypothetical protein
MIEPIMSENETETMCRASPKPQWINLVIIPCQIEECHETYTFTNHGYFFSSIQQRYLNHLLHLGWRYMKHPQGYPDLLICPDCAKKVPKENLVKFRKRRK